MALLVQKLWGGKSCQNPFLAFLRLKKNPTAIKLGGGGGGLGLNGPAIKKIIFFAASLMRM